MTRNLVVAWFAFSFVLSAIAVSPTAARASELEGFYLEARTCQVYTGPCFANAEYSLTGKDAILAWSIRKGHFSGTDVSGLNVVMVITTQNTLGFGGLKDAGDTRAVILIDSRASQQQQQALVAFARKQGGSINMQVADVQRVPVAMTLDPVELRGQLRAGKAVYLSTRKAKPTDCICSNEAAYYPPLVKVDNFAAGVTLDGGFKGRGLRTRWSVPDTRSAYMGTFQIETP